MTNEFSALPAQDETRGDSCAKFRNERGDVTPNLTEMNRILQEYYE